MGHFTLVSAVLALSYVLPTQAKQAKQAIDLDVVFKAKPSLRNVKPISTTTTDRFSAASSVVSVMNAVKSGGAATASAVKTTKSPALAPKKTSKKTTKKLITEKKTTTKKRKTTKKKTPIKNKKVLKKKSTTKKKTIKKQKTTAKKTAKQLKQRDNACSPQDIAFGYQPKPNTPTGFLVDTSLSGISLGSLAPAGYSTNFTGAYGSLFGDSYLGYWSLASYNVSQCADICDSVPACRSFNIYLERLVALIAHFVFM